MMRFTLALLALSMAACAQAPYTKAPPVAKLDLTPIVTGNKAISDGNKQIGQSAQKVQTKLEDTRAKLDAAIVAAHDQKQQNAQLDQNLKDASASLNAAITENTNLRMTTFNQQAKIDKQDEVIAEISQENNERQKIIDAQTDELNELRPQIANYKEQERLDRRWWGLGYFLHGAKVLGWHIAIVAIVLAGVGFLLNMFVPFLQPFFAKIVAFFISAPGRIARFIIGLFKRKPPS